MTPLDLFLARLENIEFDIPPEVKNDLITMMNTLKAIGDLDGFTKTDPALIHAEKECGDAEECSADFLYAVIDQRNIHSRHRKWYVPSNVLGDRTGNTRLTKKTGIGFHHTAVQDGFGAWKSQKSEHANVATANNWIAYDSGISGPPLILPGSDAYARWRVRPNKPLTLDEWARAMALGDRYRGFPAKDYNAGIPYHAIMAPNSVLYLNLPFDWVTWHGNSLNNDFLGVAWDALSTKQSIDDGLAADLIHDVIRLVQLARNEGHDIQFFDVHATRTNKPRDPGAEFIREVMMPAAEETGCTIIMDKARDGGKTINAILAA
jgi:hypothetical protein